jgi:hypothetical protein
VAWDLAALQIRPRLTWPSSVTEAAAKAVMGVKSSGAREGVGGDDSRLAAQDTIAKHLTSGKPGRLLFVPENTRFWRAQ